MRNLISFVGILLTVAIATFAWEAAQSQTNIARTVHNLSASGPGTQKDTQARGTCVYCHTPHNSNPTLALWNREIAGVTYQIYSSSSMQATVNQPTGSSRLCLSCHDGLLALGNIRFVDKGPATSSLGPLRGRTVRGTDLRGDHPVSFVYDAALAARRQELAPPASLPRGLRVDNNRQMQCATCHDAHEDRNPNFLRMNPANGALCLSCHRMSRWSSSSHAVSVATWNGAGPSPWPVDGATTVAANACSNCHRTHAAPHGERLMAQATEPDTCNVCHSASVTTKNVGAEFASGVKLSRHPIEAAQWTHAPNEDPQTMQRHVACADCHNAHVATSAAAAPGGLPGPLQGTVGADLMGTRVAPAAYEYQVCIKCHDAREPTTPGATRVETSRSVRIKINPGNMSYHPIAAAGRNTSIRGLLGGWTSSSVMGCVDCHNNSDATPRGAHASRFAPILERNFVATDLSPETPIAYDLCYKCHDRALIVSDVPGLFPHAKHVVGSQASCAACHDSHGARSSQHLINFMTRDSAGRSVALPSSSGRLEYVTTSPGRGTCYLKCHGVDHNPLSY